MFQPKRMYTLAPQIFSVTTSLLVALFALSDLEWSDRISNRRGALLFFLGLIFFTCLFNALNVLSLKTSLGQKLVKKYKVTTTDVMDISNK